MGKKGVTPRHWPTHCIDNNPSILGLWETDTWNFGNQECLGNESILINVHVFIHKETSSKGPQQREFQHLTSWRSSTKSIIFLDPFTKCRVLLYFVKITRPGLSFAFKQNKYSKLL